MPPITRGVSMYEIKLTDRDFQKMASTEVGVQCNSYKAAVLVTLFESVLPASRLTKNIT
jgi:hypothetical protein